MLEHDDITGGPAAPPEPTAEPPSADRLFLEVAIEHARIGRVGTGAILLYGIPRVVIGESRTFVGGEDHLRSRGVEVVDLDDPECVELMADFIRRPRAAVRRSRPAARWRGRGGSAGP